jgi:DNA-binding transcriptional ArsR family regulator
MEENFIRVATLIGEPARAAMLWHLLDGRAYTAGELALSADLSPSAATNHLHKLVQEGLLTIERQGRHKYFAFANAHIASVIEAMGAIVPAKRMVPSPADPHQSLRYCRKCYDHLAGQVGVGLTEALLERNFLTRQGNQFAVTEAGATWVCSVGIDLTPLTNARRPLARPCLDWSERKVHLAGSLGQALFSRFLQLDWLRLTSSSRAIVVTGKGRQQLDQHLKLSL